MYAGNPDPPPAISYLWVGVLKIRTFKFQKVRSRGLRVYHHCSSIDFVIFD
jgi:hypothetical protein